MAQLPFPFDQRQSSPHSASFEFKSASGIPSPLHASPLLFSNKTVTPNLITCKVADIIVETPQCCLLNPNLLALCVGTKELKATCCSASYPGAIEPKRRLGTRQLVVQNVTKIKTLLFQMQNIFGMEQAKLKF